MATDDQIQQRVRRAVIAAAEGLDGPDRNRLARIEQDLLRRATRRRPRRWRWALVGIGLAAGAAAAYWGVFSPEVPDERGSSTTDESAVTPASDRDTDDRAGREGEQNAHGEDESPIIYIGQ